MFGFFLSILFLLFCLGYAVCTIGKGRSQVRTNTHDDSRYAKTGNFMDFDPGVDENKIGDPEYPNAGIDSVMKHEFMNDLFDEDKN